MWNWHAGKVALEWLFFTGAVTARGRTAGFERVYDLTERVLPAGVAAGTRRPTGRRRPGAGPHRRPGARRRHRDATCATTSGCAPGDARTAVAELADAGELLPVEVAGWGRRRGWTRRRAGRGGSGPGRC